MINVMPPTYFMISVLPLRNEAPITIGKMGLQHTNQFYCDYCCCCNNDYKKKNFCPKVTFFFLGVQHPSLQPQPQS